MGGGPKSPPPPRVTRTQIYPAEDRVKPGFHIGRKNGKYRLEYMFFKAVQLWLGLYMVVMIVSIDLSREIFTIDMLRALKSSLKHRRKHVLRSLQLNMEPRL